jgi:NADH-quinone oxidoreductase subunit J
MPWDFVAFILLAAICVISAGGMVASANPVHAGIFLGICFIHVAGIFVMLGAEFLAVVQVIVYTGAILVLILFVLMLVDPDTLPEFTNQRPIQRTVAVLLGLVLLLEIAVAILGRTIKGVAGNATPENIALVGGNTQALGRSLYTEYLLPFEIASLVLTVGVIGAIVLAMPERLGERVYRRRGTISLAHPRGTDLVLPEGVRGESPIDDSTSELATGLPSRREVIMVGNAEDYTTVGRGR